MKNNVSILHLLGLLFIGLKLTDQINWSWGLVLFPIILPVIISVIVVIVSIIKQMKE